MSGQKSNYLEKALLDLVLSAAAFSPPGTVYLALFTTSPTGSGGGVEASGTGYARVAITNNSTNWPASTGGTPATKTNGANFLFPVAGGNWSSGANMVAWGLFDASSAGNLLYFGPLLTPAPVNSGQTVEFPIGSIVIQDT